MEQLTLTDTLEHGQCQISLRGIFYRFEDGDRTICFAANMTGLETVTVNGQQLAKCAQDSADR